MSFKDQDSYSEIKDRLSKAITGGKLSHAYIIEGDGMSGKENFARDFAQAILCSEEPGVGCGVCQTCRMVEGDSYRDLYWVRAAERSVKQGQIEELQQRISRNPVEPAGRNIAVIENSDSMTARAQNRLLKDLEEPHEGTVLILLCENSENLLQTIRSRCQTIRLFSGEDALTPEQEEQKALAKQIVNMIYGGDYFYKINAEIKNIDEKKIAAPFIDALEREYRTLMIEKSTEGKSAEREMESIKLIEEVRHELKYNVRAKYALGDLILKLEEL